MASKVFLDANMLLDFLLIREGHDSSQQVLNLAINGKCNAYVNPCIVQIVGHWTTKKYGSAKAQEMLLTLLSDVQVIDLDYEITVNALHSKIDDIEDALQYYTALHHKLDYFISRDKKLKKSSIPVLPVYSPEEFLKEADTTN